MPDKKRVVYRVNGCSTTIAGSGVKKTVFTIRLPRVCNGAGETVGVKGATGVTCYASKKAGVGDVGQAGGGRQYREYMRDPHSCVPPLKEWEMHEHGVHR